MNTPFFTTPAGIFIIISVSFIVAVIVTANVRRVIRKKRAKKTAAVVVPTPKLKITPEQKAWLDTVNTTHDLIELAKIDAPPEEWLKHPNLNHAAEKLTKARTRVDDYNENLPKVEALLAELEQITNPFKQTAFVKANQLNAKVNELSFVAPVVELSEKLRTIKETAVTRQVKILRKKAQAGKHKSYEELKKLLAEVYQRPYKATKWWRLLVAWYEDNPESDHLNGSDSRYPSTGAFVMMAARALDTRDLLLAQLVLAYLRQDFRWGHYQAAIGDITLKELNDLVYELRKKPLKVT